MPSENESLTFHSKSMESSMSIRSCVSILMVASGIPSTSYSSRQSFTHMAKDLSEGVLCRGSLDTRQ